MITHTQVEIKYVEDLLLGKKSHCTSRQGNSNDRISNDLVIEHCNKIIINFGGVGNGLGTKFA